MSTEGKTPEQVQQEVDARVKQFHAELIPLLKKHRLVQGCRSEAYLMPDGRVGSRGIVVYMGREQLTSEQLLGIEKEEAEAVKGTIERGE